MSSDLIAPGPAGTTALLLRWVLARSEAAHPPPAAAQLDIRAPTTPDRGSSGPGSAMDATPKNLSASSDLDLSAAVDFAERQRILPSLIDAIVSGVVTAAPEDLAEIRRREIAVASAQVSIEAALLDAAELSRRIGVEPVALKGVASAHLDYPDPALRQFGDADILVPDERFREILGMLVDHGWVPGAAIPRRHLEFAHAVPMRHPDGVAVDVHRAISRRSVGRRIPTADILGRTTTFELAGTTIGAPDAVDRLIHAAIHQTVSSGDHRRLSTTADILVLSAGPTVDPSAVVARATDWRIVELVRSAIAYAHRLADLTITDRWRSAFAAIDGRAGRDRLIESAHASDRRRPALEEVAMWRELGWSERVRYLDGYVRPGQDYFDQVGRDRRSQLTYLRSRLRAPHAR